jgi:hypothetical protein
MKSSKLTVPATLMLLCDAEKRKETFDPDVLALRGYELVEVRQNDLHKSTPRLARRSHELLEHLQMGARE